MQLRFDVDDEDAAHAAREELVGRFAKWLEDHPEHGAADAWDADLLLHWKFGYGDRDYGHWTGAQVDDVLLGHLPRKLSASQEEAASIPSSLAAFAGFLAEEGLLDERSETADAIATRARAQTRAFLDAMADPRNFGMAKRLFSSVGLDDDTVLDQAGVEAALARFNDLPFEVRGEILGLDGEDLGGEGIEHRCDLPALPLRDVPSAAEMAALAAGVPLLQRIDALHEALGPEGIRLTTAYVPRLPEARRLARATGLPGADPGVPSVAAMPELLALGRLAVEAGAVRLDKRRRPARLVPGGGWPGLPAGERWQAVVDAVLQLGPASLQCHDGPHGPLLELADQVALHIVAMLWIAGEPVPVHDFGGMLLEAAALHPGAHDTVTAFDAELRELRCRTMIDGALLSLSEAGVVTRDDDTVALTDAGARLVAPTLAGVGFDALLPEDVGDLTAAELLDTLVERDATDVDVAARFWTRGRATSPLAEELVAELEARPEPARVMVGFGVLDGLGPEAVPAVRGAVEGPIAAHAWLHLTSQGIVPPDEVPREVLVEAAIDIFVATADLGSPADVVEMALGNIPAPDHTTFVDELARADHPRTGELLETLGRHHPDRAIAKHARKAAHRWRSRRA